MSDSQITSKLCLKLILGKMISSIVLLQPKYYLLKMSWNTEPEEKISVLGLHSSHDYLHGQYPLCSVGKEGGHEVSRVLVIVPTQLDIAQGGFALLLHVLQV